MWSSGWGHWGPTMWTCWCAGPVATVRSAECCLVASQHAWSDAHDSRSWSYHVPRRVPQQPRIDLYLQVVGDGDPHSIIRPESVTPRTPTETLQQILARDDSPTSATTLLRDLSDPAARLFDAVQRYTDGLHVAAEQLVGSQIVQMLDSQADQIVPGLTSEPSWPTLRAQLLALAAETGEHPLIHLHTTAAGRDPQTAADMAAVLDWRLPELAPAGPGPVPWLPGIPEKLYEHPAWSDYLTKRSRLVADLAQQIRDHPCQDDAQPVWAPPGSHPSTALVGEVAIWRAANGVDQRDPRPTGGVQLETAPTLWQQRLDRAVALLNDLPGNAELQGGQAAHTTRDRNYDDSQRPYQTPGRRPGGPSAPGR